MRAPGPNHRRSGNSLIYCTVILSALLMFASLVVDYGRMQVAKTELRRAANAAARYGVAGISRGVAAVHMPVAWWDNMGTLSPSMMNQRTVTVK